MIQFDQKQDSFTYSLSLLSKDIQDFVKEDLDSYAANLDLETFQVDYAWRQHTVESTETYPGANEMFIFTVALPDGMRPPDDLVDIFCYFYDQEIHVICAVAQ